jgi:iduronate 2-sulfatase
MPPVFGIFLSPQNCKNEFMCWTRRQLLAVAGARAWGAAQRMNVLFMVADDLGTQLACYGNKEVKTPHLDKLASRGVLFDRAYCQFPLCAPSRASFLSGRRPETTRVLDLKTPTRKYMPDVVMLPEFFRKRGYFSAQCGKIYHTGAEHVDPRSWDFMLPEGGKNPPKSEVLESHEAADPRNHSMAWSKLKTPDERTPDGMMARKAVELMTQCAGEKKPFFMGLGFRRPHAPYAVPKKYFDWYDPAKIALPEVGDRKSLLPAAWYELDGQPPLTDRQTREYIAAFYASTSFVDAQVGFVMDHIDQLGLAGNTAIVFLGDNGYHTGEHGMWHKMTLFEESLRCPLIIAAPGAKGAGKVCGGLVEFIDVYPTLVDLCGFAAPQGLEGASLRPWLNDPARPGKKAVFSMVGRNDDREKSHQTPEWFGKTVRTERWRYTEWDGGRRGVELYDEQRDRQEMKNLANDPAMKPVIAELKGLLKP